MAENIEITDDSIQKQIIQAAQQLFRIHGFQKVTMDDVAKEIGKGRSSLYYYYKSKEEILDAAIEVEMREILTELSQAINQAPDLEQKISVYCMTRLKISKKRKGFYNMIDTGMDANEISDYIKAKNNMHTRFRQLEIPLLKGILDFGTKAGILRAIPPKEQDSLILVWLSSMQGFKKEMILKKNSNFIEPAVKMLTSLIISGYQK